MEVTKKIDEYLVEANKYDLYDDEYSAQEIKAEEPEPEPEAEKALGEYEKAIKGFKARLKALKPEFNNLLKLEKSISKKYSHLGVDDSGAGLEFVQERNGFDFDVKQSLEYLFDVL